MHLDVFKDMGNPDLVLGKDFHVFYLPYCDQLLGHHYLGRSRIEAIARKLVRAEELLKEQGTQLFLLLPPSQPRALADYLPAPYYGNINDTTNWAVFTDVFQEYDLPVVAFENLLTQDSTFPPHYPKLGLHWNMYGASVAMETFRTAIMDRVEVKLPVLTWPDQLRWQKELMTTDRELLHAANLYRPFPESLNPYPEIRAEEDSMTQKLNALVVGDSYYQILFDYGLHDQLFDTDSRFWYYFRTVYPPKEGQRKPMEYEDLANEIKDRDLLVMTYAEINLSWFEYEFLDFLLEILAKQ